MVRRRNFALVYGNDSPSIPRTLSVSSVASEADNVRKKTNTKPADDSSNDHSPESKCKGLNSTAQCENESANEQGALATNDVPDTPSSRGGDF